MNEVNSNQKDSEFVSPHQKRQQKYKKKYYIEK